MSLQHLNPDGLHRNPAFTQAIVVPQDTPTFHVGGQNAVDASGEIVGAGDIAAQAEQVFRNIETANDGVVVPASHPDLVGGHCGCRFTRRSYDEGPRKLLSLAARSGGGLI